MGAEGASLAECQQDRLRVKAAPVDVVGQIGQRAIGDAAHLGQHRLGVEGCRGSFALA